MPKIRVVQVSKAGGPFQLTERERPKAGFGEVIVKVQACGVCHSDSIAKEGLFPGIAYPIIPGHEVAGVIDEVGEGVIGWTVGMRVGVGWFGGNCGYCEPCRRGDLIDCQNIRIPGLNCDGGYAEAMVSKASGLVRIPDDLSSENAAPLLCAGVTTYNALRNSGARQGDLVAVLGLGGLGHLGVQFAAKMGFRTVAIGRGAEKEQFAKQLGAHIYIDSAVQDATMELTRLGGAKTILATVPNSKATSDIVAGLSVRGTLVIVGVGAEPLQFSALDLIAANRTIKGHASGAAIDSEDTLNFSVLSGVRPMIETLPLERAAEAYERMMAAQARFRMVLTTGLNRLHTQHRRTPRRGSRLMPLIHLNCPTGTFCDSARDQLVEELTVIALSQKSYRWLGHKHGVKGTPGPGSPAYDLSPVPQQYSCRPLLPRWRLGRGRCHHT